MGLNVAPVDAASRQHYNLGSAATGVVITGIVPHTEAAKKGFRPGDVVVMADGHALTGVDDFAADVSAVKGSGRPSVLLLVQRDGRNIPVTIPFEKPASK